MTSIIKRNQAYVDALSTTGGGDSKLVALFRDNIAALSALSAGLKPFADFVEGPSGDALHDTWPVSQGSPMARRQIIVGDCRRAAELRKELNDG